MCLVSLQLAMPWLVDSLKEKGGGVDGGQERRLGGEKGGETAMRMLKKKQNNMAPILCHCVHNNT